MDENKNIGYEYDLYDFYFNGKGFVMGFKAKRSEISIWDELLILHYIHEVPLWELVFCAMEQGFIDQIK
jgi:hypothetical protein